MVKQSTDPKNPWHLFSRKSSYNELLTSLILIFFLAPIIPGKVGKSIISIIFLVANLWQINALNLPNNILFIFRNVAVLAFISSLIPLTVAGWLADWGILLALVVYSLFISLAIAAINSRIFVEVRVNRELIKGGICIFLMLGLLWSLLYQITSFFTPESFKYLSTQYADEPFIYFSFTTLTTLGYGDVTPVTPFARALTNAEAIVGQLYPSIYIARLVALWQPEKQDSLSEE